MTPNKNSLLVASQLPAFVSENPDYANFVLFLQAYYEWMEQNGNLLDSSKNLLAYKDIDTTTNQFLKYFINDFLPYFPQDALISQQTAIKAARQLYQTKGTIASYQFLFRILFNSDFEVFNTGDSVFKASSGTWYVAKSLKLASTDPNFLITTNLRVFGETTKTIATIESVVLAGNKTEVFISNIERLFKSGEIARIVDNNNQDVYFLNDEIVPTGTPGAEVLRSKIVGQLSSVNIDPLNRGLQYSVGDPVIVYGGLNPDVQFPVGANASISATTTGAIKRIDVINGGYGYSISPAQGQIEPFDSNYTKINISDSSISKAHASVVSVDPSAANNSILTLIPLDSIGSANDVTIGNSQYSFFQSGTHIQLSQPVNYANGEIVYQGNTLSSNTFSGKVFVLSNTLNYLLANNTTGTINLTSPLKGNTSNAIRYVTLVQNIGGGNTQINFSNGYFNVGETVYQGTNLASTTFSGHVVSVNTSTNLIQLTAVNGVPSVGTNIIGYSSNVSSNVLYVYTANVNTTLAQAFHFASFSTYPISSVAVDNGGGGISQIPTVAPQSVFLDDIGNENDLGTFGILAPIQIANPGAGYHINDKINITGGSGYGAYANVTNVDASGAITSVSYVYSQNSDLYPLGGLGYTLSALPIVTITTANTSPASLYVPGVVGQGAQFSIVTDRVGSITTITLNYPGDDYVEVPNVSLKIQDIVVSNVFVSNLPQKGFEVYQGANVKSTSYTATVDSITLLQGYQNPANSIYNLRVFNYNSNPNPTLPLKIASNTGISMIMANTQYNQYYDTTGVRRYGDGTALAQAKFLNGLVISQGQYINSQGQPSSYDVIQSSNFNNYTYQITVEKEIEKYRDILLNLLHPSGMNIIGRYAIKSNVKVNFAMTSEGYTGNNLSDYAGTNNPQLVIQGSFSNPSNNIIQFSNIPVGETMSSLVPPGSIIRFTTTFGDELGSSIVSSNDISNTVVMQSNTWVAFGNVAYVTGNTGQNYININSITNAYGVVKGGQDSIYYNTYANITLGDIVRTGDIVQVSGNTYTTASVDFINNIVYFTTNLTSNVSNSLISVNRTYVATAPYIQIFNSSANTQNVELTTEDGIILTTEDGNILLIN
jgi:hypothetical protein